MKITKGQRFVPKPGEQLIVDLVGDDRIVFDVVAVVVKVDCLPELIDLLGRLLLGQLVDRLEVRIR